MIIIDRFKKFFIFIKGEIKIVDIINNGKGEFNERHKIK